MTAFFLGAHRAHWLELAGVPLFVSRRTLARLRTLPRAAAPWALDSGGFTEIAQHGRWTVTPAAYVAELRRYRDEIGRLEWAAPQDWMCEPAMLAKTGLDVATHQARTLANYLELRALAPELPIVPVLQGWTVGDYWRHVEAYAAAGVDLAQLPLVGVGTVCRRQSTLSAGVLLATLAAAGIRLHGFGFKVAGLRRSAASLASADSMAWSFNARMNAPTPGHDHPSCTNCLPFALDWRAELVASLN
jgi:hypothetical protein